MPKLKKTEQQDSMRWYSHRRSCARDERCTERRPRGRLPKEVVPHFSVFICPRWPWPSTFDLDIRAQARFLYIAPNCQVSSSYAESFGSYRANKRTDKQTNRQTDKQTPLKHPPPTSLRYTYAGGYQTKVKL